MTWHILFWMCILEVSTGLYFNSKAAAAIAFSIAMIVALIVEKAWQKK